MTQVEAVPPFDFGSLAPNLLRPLSGRVVKPWAKIACPACHAAFHPAKVAFRCVAEPAVCPPEFDRIAAKRLGAGEPPLLPHAILPKRGIAAAGLARIVPPRQASCDLCGTSSDHRLCPACHAPLPRSLGQVDVLPIVTAGTTASGKSTWLAVLTERLESGAGAAAGAAFWPDGEAAERRLRQFYRDPLYAQGHALAPTGAADKDGRVLEPLYQRFDLRKGRSALLALHDSSGRDLASDAGALSYAGAVGLSAGIAFLVAPEDLPEFGGNPSAMAAALGRLISMLEAAGRKTKDGLIDVPIAIVLTKLDRIAPRLPEGVDMLAQGDPTAVGQALASDEIEAYLSAWGGGAVPTLVRTRFAKFAFFATSALGREPQGEIVEAPRAFRVEEALLWLLAAQGRLVPR